MSNIKSLIYDGGYDYKGEKLKTEMFSLTLKVFKKALATEIKSVELSNEFDNKIILPKHWFKNKNII
jgi:hypothetical protein